MIEIIYKDYYRRVNVKKGLKIKIVKTLFNLFPYKRVYYGRSYYSVEEYNMLIQCIENKYINKMVRKGCLTPIYQSDLCKFINKIFPQNDEVIIRWF